MWMTNLDKIIDGVNAEGTIKAMYSTPSIYLKAKHAENVQWSVKTDDFFPYADGGDSYWTGSPSFSPTSTPFASSRHSFDVNLLIC